MQPNLFRVMAPSNSKNNFLTTTMAPRCHCQPESLMDKDVLDANRLAGKAQAILGEMWGEACGRGNSLSFKVASGSMRPTIEVGDVVRVSRAEPSKIQIGDIIAFRNGQNVIVHRVIGKSWSNRQLNFRHMGDAGTSPRTIPAQNLIGVVNIIEKKGTEIHLNSPMQVIGTRVSGWRLKIVGIICRRRYRRIGIVLRIILRPIWRSCRSLWLRR